jgi:hypothetical protein
MNGLAKSLKVFRGRTEKDFKNLARHSLCQAECAGESRCSPVSVAQLPGFQLYLQRHSGERCMQ